MIHALYPGSFDPVTNGHVDIARRASEIFRHVTVGVYDTPQKKLLFSTEERVELMKKATAHLKNVDVIAYSGLTIVFAKQIKAKVLIRGLRMGSDFDAEFEMALMNKKLAPDLETVCFMTNEDYEFVSSSIIKEAAKLGGYIDSLVPKHVVAALKVKFDI